MATTEPKPAPCGWDELIDPERARRVVAVVLGIAGDLAYRDALGKLSNYELAGLLIDHFWAYLPADQPQAHLIDEVIQRLKGNVEDDECPVCAASGKGPDGAPNACPRCRGNGVVVTGQKAAQS